MFIVYILKSVKTNKYYTGQTRDVGERLLRHNAGKVTSTKKYLPWTLVHTESCSTRTEARRRELEIKQYKGGILFKRLLGLWKEDK